MIECLVPPVVEQAEIVSHIDTSVAQIDSLVQEGQVAMELLGERRSALISAAVTGQIDVRGLTQHATSP